MSQRETEGHLRQERIYDGVGDDDGRRILVDRLWPRGVSKERAALTLWAKDITPSAELRKAYHAGRLTYEAFAGAYEQELRNNPAWPAFVERVAAWLREGNVTLLTAAKDTAHSHMPVLWHALQAALGAAKP